MKLTHKEHTARAMLMGRVYDWTDGTYCTLSLDKTGSLDPMTMIDAVTLQPVTQHVATDRRILSYDGTPAHWSRPPLRKTDWARMDDDD